MSITLEASQDEVANLVRHFKTNLASYRGPGYKEAQARQEFIDPLFAALGWDVHNAQHAAPAYREVVVEASQPVEGHQRAPDYAFRIGRETKFYAEAKKPGIDLKADAGPAYQLRRYAWSARLPLSVLTDFEEFAAYDCRKRPSEQDRASAARTQYLKFEEYPDRWREVWEVFSREAVLGGAFDQFAGGATRRGASAVDVEFLKEIEIWRELLARNFALRNPRLSVDELNDAVQRTIDRIVFLRMAEDRGMEEYGRLERLAKADGAYAGLIRLARQADDKYNSGLFDFARDKLTPRLELDDKILQGILRDLYFPHSPYAFNVLPPEILGSVYERFLGKVVRLTAGHQAKVEDKPEVRKAGGVYYTPAYIVDYIVKQTVGQQIEGQSPSELRGFRVLDMACGSGSFLLGAYQALLDHYLQWYSENSPEKYPKALYSATPASGYLADPRPSTEVPIWLLTSAERKRILTEHIFGVDIDRQAVEVTKLSLLLKVLEGETDETLGRQMRLIHDRALPDLDRNIHCGNSLIGPDYFQGRLLPDPDELKRINAFDWKAAFSEAMAAGGFDAVIGNPPYVRIQTMKEWAPLEVEAYKDLYRSARSGNYDIYVVFVERGLSLLNKNGHLGFILPHKFFNAKYGENLRSLIAEGQYLEHVVHFGDQQVFGGATTYTALIFLTKGGAEYVRWESAYDLAVWRVSPGSASVSLPAKKVTMAEWNFVAGRGLDLADKLSEMPYRLGDLAHIFVGLQTSADTVFLFKAPIARKVKVTTVSSKELGKAVTLENDILKPVVRSGEIGRYWAEPSALVLFPYELNAGKATLLTAEEFERRLPKAWEYLGQNRTLLAGREHGKFSGAGWYQLYPKNLSLWEQPKILVPYMTTRLSAHFDETGLYFVNVTTGGFGITANPNHGSLKYLTGLLNSRLLDWCLKRVAARFHGGYFAANKQYIGRLPIRPINFSDPADKARHDKMVTLVERMLELHKRRQVAESDGERETLQRQIDATDRQIDALVYELYGLTEEEIRLVEGTEAAPSTSEESETAS